MSRHPRSGLSAQLVAVFIVIAQVAQLTCLSMTAGAMANAGHHAGTSAASMLGARCHPPGPDHTTRQPADQRPSHDHSSSHDCCPCGVAGCGTAGVAIAPFVLAPPSLRPLIAAPVSARLGRVALIRGRLPFATAPPAA